jgi:hypothetical protein
VGFIKDTKAQNLGTEAKRAVEQGRTVFAPKLNTPMSQHNMSGAIAGWAEMVEAVEAQGWRLDQWSVAIDNKGRPEAYPLFRRV